MGRLKYQDLFNVTHPEQYEATLLQLPHIESVRAEHRPAGSQARLRVLRGEQTTFYRSTWEGRRYLILQGVADLLNLQCYVDSQHLVWRSPHQTLYQAPLPVLVLPEQAHQISSDRLDALVAHFSYRRMLTEVAIARAGEVSPTLFLLQGRPEARLQCRRIMEEINDGLEVGLTEESLALLERALITTVAHHWNPDERSFAASYRHVTLALDWMQHHLSQPFPWSDLCRDVGVSQRCLELAFQRELAMSPNRWLKQERLRRLRQLLLDGDRCIGVPLARLFERCGLPYCGTSQRAYNRLYGETPVHTRHRVARGR